MEQLYEIIRILKLIFSFRRYYAGVCDWSIYTNNHILPNFFNLAAGRLVEV